MARERTRKKRGRDRDRGRASPHGARALTARAALARGAVFLAVWWALTEGAGAPLFAAVLVPLALAASLVLDPPGPGRISPAGLARFVPFFLWASLHGGIDVARRALAPRLRIAPALRDYPLHVSDERERVLVASVLSLMPGSVSATLERDRVRLHVLDQSLPIERTLRQVEAHVAAVFGRRLSGGRGRARGPRA